MFWFRSWNVDNEATALKRVLHSASDMDVDESTTEAPLVSRDPREAEAFDNHDGDNIDKPKAKISSRRDRDAFEREVGRSAFPITRVQKILKADKVFNCNLMLWYC